MQAETAGSTVHDRCFADNIAIIQLLPETRVINARS